MSSSEEYLNSLLNNSIHSGNSSDSGMERIASSRTIDKMEPEQEIKEPINQTDDTNHEDDIFHEDDMAHEDDIFHEDGMAHDDLDFLLNTSDEDDINPIELHDNDINVTDTTDDNGEADNTKSESVNEIPINNTDTELDEINTLLNNNVNTEPDETDDMLALLESVSDHNEEQKNQNSDVNDDFDIFAMDMMDDVKNESEISDQQQEPETNDLDGLLQGIEEKEKHTEEDKSDSDNNKKKKKEKKKHRKKGNESELSNELSDAQNSTENEVESLFSEDASQQIELSKIPEKNAKEHHGLLHKIMELLFSEDEETKVEKVITPEDEFLGNPSDENIAILQELDEENANKKSGKDNKKKKGKKQKTKNKNSEDEEGEEGESKGKKGKKAKKTKKEKPVDEEDKVNKNFTLEKILPIFIFATTLLIIIILVAIKIPENIQKQNARDAYYNQDYNTAYELLSGYKLSKSDGRIYKKASVLLRVSCKIDSFELNSKLGQELDALDSLFQGVARYYELLQISDELGISDELNTIYDEILKTMNDTYGLSEDDINTVLSYEDDVVYTRILHSVIEGNGIDIFHTVIPDIPVESNNDMNQLDQLEDVLDEESEAIDQVQDYVEQSETSGNELSDSTEQQPISDSDGNTDQQSEIDANQSTEQQDMMDQENQDEANSLDEPDTPTISPDQVTIINEL